MAVATLQRTIEVVFMLSVHLVVTNLYLQGIRSAEKFLELTSELTA